MPSAVNSGEAEGVAAAGAAVQSNQSAQQAAEPNSVSSQAQDAWGSVQYGGGGDPSRIWSQKYASLRGGGGGGANHKVLDPTDKEDSYNPTTATVINDYQLHQLQILQVSFY